MSKILTDDLIPTMKGKMVTLPVNTADIADNAVTAAKADVDGIMNYAGTNGLMFGIGGNCYRLGIGYDLDLVPQRTGFYTGTQLTHAPNGNTDWWYIEQMVNSTNFVLQRATYLKGTTDIYQRIKSEGTWTNWRRIMTSVNTIEQIYPVGSIYISLTLDTAEKVAAALGGGAWVRTAVGATIVGVDSSQTEFNTVAKIGGSKTVTLTTEQIPSHTHQVYLPNYGASTTYANGSHGFFAINGGDYGNTKATGGGQAHNNLQPYVTFYTWKRTA